MENFWDSNVWGSINLLIVLLIALIAANMLKRSVRWLEASLIPTSVLGGAMLLAVAGIYKLITGDLFFDTAFFGANGMAGLEIITYHTLALGFIASAFKSGKGKLTKKRTVEIFNTGVNTVATYLLQAVVGFGITIIAALVIKDFFSAAGVLLPFGYGQGTGQAMNYGGIYENDFGFEGGKSFGLTIAALGFISASVGGVIHLNILKRQGKIKVAKREEAAISTEQVQGENEIPMQGSMDKLTVQLAFVAGAYFLAYLMMYGLGLLLPGMKSVIYGFNFLLGVIAATLVKAAVNFLQKKKIINRKYANDFLMTRCSNFFFDIMVVAGIAAIRLGILEKYWGVILILGVVGLVITYAYNLLTARVLFKEYSEEQFLTMYGMLTGTASTGIILLREIDNGFETPAADNLVYQNFPAIVFGFPLMLLATLAPQKPLLTWGILLLFFIVMNVILFRSKIFRKAAK
ncbi:MAG: hypothetical protein IJ043_10250 [Clostridia bacterium]|nr:hypothetical protein [Clostridia bacterium]